MNRPIGTRVLESLNKYILIVNSLEPKHPEFSELIHLAKLVIHGLAKYYTLFILDQHEKVVRVARIEDDYSRNVTLIGRRLRTWATRADLTLKGKMVLDQLYLVLQRCLRDALELYTESERELIREGTKIYLSASDAYGEYERANAALWKFQNAFHLYQIDFSRGSSDRAIIFGQATYAGPPAGFGNFEFVTREWQEPDRNNMNNFTEEEQERLKALLNAPKVQTLLPEELRDPNISLSPVRDDNDDGRKKILPYTIYPHRFMHKVKGVLKTPKFEPPRRKPKKMVNFESSEHSPLPDDNVHSTRGRGGCEFILPEDTPSRPPPTNGSKKRPVNPADQTFDIPTDPYRPPLPPLSSGSPKPAGTTTPIPVESVTPGGSDSSEDSSVSDGAVEKITIADILNSVISPASFSSSSSLPSVGSLSPKRTPSPTEDGDEDATASNLSEEEDSDELPTSSTSTECSEISLARPAEEVRRQVALSARAYLGRRLDEYGVALAADPDIDSAEDDEDHGDEDDEEDGPRDEDYTTHHPLRRSAHDQSARYVKNTALLHWAGVGKAKREERINGYTRLRAFLKWAEGEGRVPLSPSSIRASTGLRRGLFEPLGPPDLPAPKKARRKQKRQARPGPYREATLASLAQLQPRLDVSLMAFLANQDALRVFGGLVGETPQPRDLARMDRLLRELEVYTAVCAHRRGLIVSHLKKTRQFPTSVAAQFGDLRAARADAEDDHLSASRRCFDYVAERSHRVMTYQGKRRKKEFAGGSLSPRDRDRLKYLAGVEDEAQGLRAELEAAEGWLGWCRDVMGRWARGWRPGRVEREVLYVDEETLADVRRYKWEINQKRVAIGLVTVKRPQDEVYERQQEHIRLLDRLWKVMN